MTISELYKQVAQLGFEDSLEDEERFIFATNRAILQVCKVRPAISSYLINHKPLRNLIERNTFEPVEKDGELIFEVEGGKSYYFEADGNGAAYLEKLNQGTGQWSIIGGIALSSDGAFKAYRGFVKDGNLFVEGVVRLRFTGEYFYSVRNVAFYSQLLSASVADIPAYEAYIRYDISKLAADFMELCCPPIKEGTPNAILNQNYEIEGVSTILIPRENKGLFRVLYIRRPQEIINTGDSLNDNTAIDLDDELSALVPLLVAAYVWIDDEPSRTEYYMNLYRERVAEIEYKNKNAAPVAYKSENGW